MVTSARRHPYIDFIKSSSNDYKLDVETYPCISYHHYYPCFGGFYYCNPYFIINFNILVLYTVSTVAILCAKVNQQHWNAVK